MGERDEGRTFQPWLAMMPKDVHETHVLVPGVCQRSSHYLFSYLKYDATMARMGLEPVMGKKKSNALTVEPPPFGDA